MDSLQDLAQIAPLATATIALLAFIVAALSLQTQKQIARRRAAIDFFLKTEMDKDVLAAFFSFSSALHAMENQPSIEEFARTPDYKAIRNYLDINELLAIGVRKQVFDEEVCYGFWRGVLDRAATRARPVIDHARRPPHENTYENLLALHARWKARQLQSLNP
jgi:uncharacterized protein DUF4760